MGSIWPFPARRSLPIGRAGIYEDDAALFAELVFDLERVPAGAFPRTLPGDPEKARAAMTIGRHVKAIERDEARKLVTRAKVEALSIAARDPAGETIVAMIDAREED